ncbi:MAG: hypothetical protein LBV74_18755 [Tannerella sp.]|jgi:hypothetical protein|nr:hypothetical protein [Tannerella sp.]
MILQVKSFDYDGQKYRSKDAGKLATGLRNELDAVNAELVRNDVNIYCFFYKRAFQKGQEGVLKEKYFNLFGELDDINAGLELYQHILDATGFLSVVTPADEIRRN